MLAPAVTFYSCVLAVHIGAVVVAFGVTFTYPLFFALARRQPEHLGFAYRLAETIDRRVVAPGLAVVVLAGVYLASKGDYWSQGWVGFALVAAIVLGAIGGAVTGPAYRKVNALYDEGRGGTGLPEERAAARRLQIGGSVASAIVLLTILDMVTKPFS
jgi:Predicted integral membrane protein (DUF2269)